MRRADRARAHDHLPGCAGLGRRPVAQVADARAAAVRNLQAGNHAAGVDGQVRAAHRGGQVGIRRADPPPAGDGQIGPRHPVLPGAAEVIAGRAAELEEGPGERDRNGVPVRSGDRGDLDRARHAAQRRVAALGVLAAPQVRQQVREPPAGRPARGPAVIDRPVAADVGHGVDRAGPAQRPAPRVGHRPGIGLGAGDISPVRRAAQQVGPGVRHGHGAGPLRAAGFQQQHPGTGILGEPGGQHAAGRARPHDDVVELRHGLPSTAVTRRSSPR